MAERKTKNNSKKEEYSELYNSWMDYSKEMTDRIKELTQERTKEYEDLFNIWSQYSQDMTEQVSNVTPKDGPMYQKMQKFLTDYSEEIQDRFVDLIGKDNGPYKDLYKLWTDYSHQMSSQFSELLNENISEQKDLYEIWMDTFGIKEKHMQNKIPMNFGDISQFWLDMWGQSQNMYPPSFDSQKDVTQHIKDFNDLWTKAYNKMVMEYVRSSHFAQLNGDILDKNLDLTQQNNELVNKYLETMGLPTKENIDEIYLQLHEMDRKLAKISREMRTKGSSKRK